MAYPLALPLLTTAFPFGLWTHQRRVEVASRLLVWPRIVPLEALPLDQGRSWTLGGLSDRRSGQEGEVIGTRLYRPGDLLRHVHWAQTARQGQMIVCERQASLTSSVRVVIDGSAAAHVGRGPNSSLEWTLRVAASVCHALLDHDARLLVALGDSLLDIAPGGKGKERLCDALARFQLAESITAAVQPGGASRQQRAARSRHRSSELEIVVTTDRAAADWSRDAGCDRRIIVLSIYDEMSAWPSREKPSLNAWFVLDCGRDVAVQLKDSWERAWSSVTAGVFGVVAIAALTLGSAGSTVALGGWFWGSGGTGRADPFAARGVGDGDQLVAAKDEAASFGAVESELFLDSEVPSLYDMFNDMYGEPVNKKRENERAIGLAPSPEAPKEQRTAQSRQSGLQ